MPDIGTLPILSEILGVSIDSILKGTSGTLIEKKTKYDEEDIVKEVTQGNYDKIGEMINNSELKADCLENLSLVLKASTLDKITKNVEKTKLNVEQISNLAPFASSDTLDRLISNLKDGEIDYKLVTAIAPFVSSNIIDELVDKIVKS